MPGTSFAVYIPSFTSFDQNQNLTLPEKPNVTVCNIGIKVENCETKAWAFSSLPFISLREPPPPLTSIISTFLFMES